LKQLIGTNIGSYDFDVTAKTLSILDVKPLKLEQILLITNVTKGQQMYVFNSAPLVTIHGNILDLAALDLTGMNDTDRLQIFVDTIFDTTYPLSKIENILEEILFELKSVNIHLAVITDEEV